MTHVPWRDYYSRFYGRVADIGSLPTRVKYEKMRRAYYLELWGSAAANIGAEFEPSPNTIHRISRDGLVTYVKQTRVRVNDSLVERLLIDKVFTQNFLQSGHHPIPQFRQFTSHDYSDASNFVSELPGRVVVKPASGTSGGKGITTNVDQDSLREAMNRAGRHCGKVLVEEFIEGDCYRLTYLDGKLVDALQRGAPTVIGDGRSSIRQLIDRENTLRLTQKPATSLLPISIDSDCKQFLQNTNQSLTNVPDQGVRLPVKTVINENSSRDCRNVLDEIHPTVAAAGEQIVKDLGMTWAGLDILSSDISSPVESNKSRIIEINAPPGIHYHYFIDNPEATVPMAELLLEYMFSNRVGTSRF